MDEPASPVEPADEVDENRTEMGRAGDAFARAWLAYLQATTAIQKQVAEVKEDITDEQLDAQEEVAQSAPISLFGTASIPAIDRSTDWRVFN